VSVVALAVGALLLWLFSGDKLLARLIAFGNPISDYSTLTRIVAPLMITGDYLRDHPAGVTFSALANVLEPYVAGYGVHGYEILDNSLFNLLFCYGLFGFPALFAFLFSSRDPVVRCYLLIATSFNGALFTIDKFPIICLAIAVYESNRHAHETLNAQYKTADYSPNHVSQSP
jgi:hypothetical protein